MASPSEEARTSPIEKDRGSAGRPSIRRLRPRRTGRRVPQRNTRLRNSISPLNLAGFRRAFSASISSGKSRISPSRSAARPDRLHLALLEVLEGPRLRVHRLYRRDTAHRLHEARLHIGRLAAKPAVTPRKGLEEGPHNSRR